MIYLGPDSFNCQILVDNREMHVYGKATLPMLDEKSNNLLGLGLFVGIN